MFKGLEQTCKDDDSITFYFQIKHLILFAQYLLIFVERIYKCRLENFKYKVHVKVLALIFSL